MGITRKTDCYIIDSLYNISISDLNKWGYLKSNKTGSIYWIRNGVKTGSILIQSFINHSQPHIKLSYTNNSKDFDYQVLLEKVESNLKPGSYFYYFICSFSKKRAHKLYKAGSYFKSRHAFKYMYDIQTESHLDRGFNEILGNSNKLYKLKQELLKSYRKKHYRGELTPLARKIERLSYKDISLNSWNLVNNFLNV